MAFPRLFATLRNAALGLLVGAAALGASHAAVVNVSASQSSVQLGGSFSLYFDISGLAPSSLGAFDLDLNFDDTLLAFTGYSFDDNLSGLNQLDLPEATGFGFLGDAADVGGVVDAFGFSGNSLVKLDSEQADNFRFLTLSFTTLALSSGTTLGIALNDPTLLFSDASANDLAYSFGNDAARVVITSATGGGTVPEPGALALVLAALAAAALVSAGGAGRRRPAPRAARAQGLAPACTC